MKKLREILRQAPWRRNRLSDCLHEGFIEVFFKSFDGALLVVLPHFSIEKEADRWKRVHVESRFQLCVGIAIDFPHHDLSLELFRSFFIGRSKFLAMPAPRSIA